MQSSPRLMPETEVFSIIDIESEVFNRICNAVREKYPSSFITGEYVKSPSEFPAVSLVEMDNLPYEKTMTVNPENHVTVTYEVNVYSNLVRGKKSECKSICAIIDNEMAAMGFIRTSLSPVPNMDDATIYRMTGRYRAVVSANHTIYRR